MPGATAIPTRRPIRRTDHETRIELLPLIDVVFLILTFFIYAMVLMVPIELLPVPLQTFASGEPATPAPAVSVTIALDGQVFVNRRPAQADEAIEQIIAAHEAEPATVVYLVLAAGEGTVDRAPVLTDLWDRLKDQGLQIRLVGRAPDAAP